MESSDIWYKIDDCLRMGSELEDQGRVFLNFIRTMAVQAKHK
jgi:hypothetical protein